MSILTALRLLPGLAVLALLAAFLRANDKAHDWKVQATHCAEARKADRKSYEDAQKQAADKNRADVERIETEQKAINNEAISDLNSRLERLRRELRNQAAPAPGGASGKAGASQAGGQPGTPEEAGVCLAPEELLRGAENEERHDQLITVVERLLKLLNTPD